jgi:hypothetical protein
MQGTVVDANTQTGIVGAALYTTSTSTDVFNVFGRAITTTTVGGHYVLDSCL